MANNLVTLAVRQICAAFGRHAAVTKRAVVPSCAKCRVIHTHSYRLLYSINRTGISSGIEVKSRHYSSMETFDPEAEAETQLANLEPAAAKKLQIIQLEMSVSREFGHRVPETINASQWVKLLELETVTSRRKYALYLQGIEKSRKFRKEKQKAKQLLHAELEDSEHSVAEFNTIFMLVRSSTMNVFYNNRLVHALTFGPHLVIDLSFADLMVDREHKNLVLQILMAHGHNKLEREPFHFMLTSAGPENPIMKAYVHSAGGRENEKKNYMISWTEKSVLDVYPRNKIVYLSPNAPNELTCYDPSDVYVIGGFVDKSNPKPVTMAFAKKHKLRMARLPLDRYLSWSMGTKSLTVDQVIKIMLDLKRTNDWNIALRNVPTRKLKS